MANLINKTLANRYRVTEFIGRGGMAEVYKVWDAHRSTTLAIKVMHADLSLDRAFLRRFKREAETLARLQHPNIVRFYGLEQDEYSSFMVMDYVEGKTLKHKIFDANGPMPIDEVLKIMRPLCQALQYAHNEGFVHSDVKPGNVLIDDLGRVMLTDFGIARMTETATVTMIGAGTPAYMSPEQARGEVPTKASDIYALGVLLFEMLTGERPFNGESSTVGVSTSEKVRWEQINLEAPSPKELNKSLPENLSSAILKALEKNPAQRFVSALDFLNAIELGKQQQHDVPLPVEPALEPRQIVSKPPASQKPVKSQEDKAEGPLSFRKIIPILSLLGVLGIVGLGVLLFMKPIPASQAPLPASAHTSAATNTQLVLSTETFQPTSTLVPTFTITATLIPTKIPTMTPMPLLLTTGEWLFQKFWCEGVNGYHGYDLSTGGFYTIEINSNGVLKRAKYAAYISESGNITSSRNDPIDGTWSIDGNEVIFVWGDERYIGELEEKNKITGSLGGLDSNRVDSYVTECWSATFEDGQQ